MTDDTPRSLRRERTRALASTIVGIALVLLGLVVILQAWITWNGYQGTVLGVTEDRGRDVAMRYVWGGASAVLGAVAAVVGLWTIRVLDGRMRQPRAAS